MFLWSPLRCSSSFAFFNCLLKLAIASLILHLNSSAVITNLVLFLTLFKTLEPRFEDLKSDGFHGLVKENERTVVVSPRIKVVDGKS